MSFPTLYCSQCRQTTYIAEGKQVNTIQIKTNKSKGLYLNHSFHTNQEALDYISDLEDANIKVLSVKGLPFIEEGDLK